MTIIIYSVVAAALLIMLSKIPLGIAMSKSKGGYDNRYPRDQQAALQGFGKRALSAHQNCIEAFPLFAAGVCLSLIAKADMALVQNLCVVFICSRMAYLICYWMDIEKLRSLIWSVGFICSIWLMILGLPTS